MKPFGEGDSLGRYRLVRRIGSGGMGEVFLAKVVGAGRFEKLVAVKVLTPEGESSARHRDSLEREALLAVRLDHDAIVDILDYGEDAGRHYIVMEFVRGFSLAHLLRHAAQTRSPLPARTAVHIARVVAGALAYLHRQRAGEGTGSELLHGDVTPSNILLSAEGRIKLTDFGIAAAAAELRHARAVAGKPRYLPPEVQLGAPQSQAVDVFALSVTLWEMLATRPFPVAATREDLERAARSPAPPLGVRRPDVPEPLEQFVSRACDGRLAERLRDIASWLAALDAAYPRAVDDAETHEAFIREQYSDPDFVASYGPLPSTGSLGRTYRLAPHVSAGTDATVSVPRKATPLRFGMSPAISSELARKAGEQFALEVAARLGRPVRPTVFGDYQTLADALVRGDVDFAWTPPQVFVEVYDHGAGMLAIMERQGRTVFHAGVFVRADAPHKRLADLRGARAAWVDRQSASGYLVPYAAILETLGPDPIPLGQQHFHGSHRVVVEAVLNGWADFGATYAHRPATDPSASEAPNHPASPTQLDVLSGDSAAAASAGWIDLAPEASARFRAVALVGPIPGDNLSHCPLMPAGLVEELIAALTALHQTDGGKAALGAVLRADRLVPGDAKRYEALSRAVALVRQVDASP